MRVAELATLYLLLGTGLALAAACRPRQPRGERLADAAILLLLWPLYAPFLWSRRAEIAAPPEGGVLRGSLGALSRAEGAPLAVLLPDRETVARLSDRLETAGARVAEIEALLHRPEMSEPVAEERAAVLEARGEAKMAALVRNRARYVRRLREQRDRFVAELGEANELLVQLRLQAEMVRFSADDGIDAAGASAEIQARLRSLDALLDEGA